MCFSLSSAGCVHRVAVRPDRSIRFPVACRIPGVKSQCPALGAIPLLYLTLTIPLDKGME